MNANHYLKKDIVTFLKRRKIATLKQLSGALGDAAPRTVFRKLQEVGYLTSYSHAGKYYTLPEVAQFTSIGLWSHKSVWFSRFGNLLDTAVAFVDQSEAGYSARELCDILHVQIQPSLMKLCQDGKLQRNKIQGRYIKQQIKAFTKRQLPIISVDTREYETGVKVSDDQFSEINLKHYRVNPEWNYSIMPNVT